ncbi:MAG: hypothetical protein JNK72_20005 [Myxococcales bacterium]|nr:hypothetical protein [Myxococcales bacterium]
MTAYRAAPAAPASTALFKPRWVPHEGALAPVAALAEGAAAGRLAQRLLEASEGQRGAWRGVAGEALVVVLGPSLPWVDGVRYLGRPADAMELLVPTAERLDVPWALVARSLGRRDAVGPTPWALWPRRDGGVALASVAAARPITRGALEAWVAARGR